MARRDQDMGIPVPDLDYIKNNIQDFMYFNDEEIASAMTYIRDAFRNLEDKPDIAFKSLAEEMGYIAVNMEDFYIDFESIDENSDDMSEDEQDERIAEIRRGEHFIVDIDGENFIISGKKLRYWVQIMLAIKCRNMICYLNSCLNWIQFVGIPFNVGEKKEDEPQVHIDRYIDFFIDMRRIAINIYNNICPNEYYVFLLAEPMTRMYNHWDPYDGYKPNDIEYYQGLI